MSIINLVILAMISSASVSYGYAAVAESIYLEGEVLDFDSQFLTLKVDEVKVKVPRNSVENSDSIRGGQHVLAHIPKVSDAKVVGRIKQQKKKSKSNSG